MSTTSRRGLKRQSGQAVVLIAFMIIVILGAVGLAVDGGIAYYYNASAERAAAAAALSGVVFMPYQFSPSQAIPLGSGYDASDRAITAAQRNGFPTTSGLTCGATCNATGPNGIAITISPVAGADNRLSVTVTRTVSTFFMGFWGLPSYTVSRTAIATYLPPIKLGQSGGQVGSTVSQLGTGGSNFYFLRTEGWATDRGQGDAYTPNPSSGCVACPSSDYHQLSAFAGTDIADPSLPGEGGYNYMITVPAGQSAEIQVYNSAFAPDGNVSGPNYCENFQTGFAGHACSSGGSYYMHEDDCCAFNYGTKTTYAAMKYTIFAAPSVFIRNIDSVISQILVKPVDASCWQVSGSCTQIGYTDVNTGKFIPQYYNASGTPTDMLAYHAWMNVGGYVPSTTCNGAPCAGNNEPESALVSYTPGKGPLPALGPGTYRLRIDTLEYDGGNPCNPYPTSCTGQSYAHKGMSVRVTDAGGVNPCGGCTISAVDDMSIYTPIALPGGGSFPLQIFQLPPDYAGQTISFEVFDAGDMSGSGSIYLGLVDPTTGNLVVEPAGGLAANVFDCGSSRSNYPATCANIGTYANPNGVEQIVTNGGTYLGDNKWYHYDVPIPSTYAPGANPNNWWWDLRYRTTGAVTATDTITITLNLKGNPAHLVQS